MEFPNLGEHCQKPECNQTDFLPLQCKCEKVFCREHFNDHCLSGECEMLPKPKEVNLKNDDQIFRCSQQGCRKGSLHENLCPKCNKHYCIEHRFHANCARVGGVRRGGRGVRLRGAMGRPSIEDNQNFADLLMLEDLPHLGAIEVAKTIRKKQRLNSPERSEPSTSSVQAMAMPWDDLEIIQLPSPGAFVTCGPATSSSTVGSAPQTLLGIQFSCPEIDEKTLANKIEQFEAPRRQFREANKLLQEKITKNIRQALQTPKSKTAAKIHLMRIKQKAIGPKSVNPNHRVYFSIKKPSSDLPKDVDVIDSLESLKSIETFNIDPDLKGTIPVFVSKNWTIGKALDSICESCNVKNENNIMGSPKLRLFRQLDGYCISPNKMEIEIEELIKKEVLVGGDRLVLEYIDEKVLTELCKESQIFLQS